MKKVREFYNVRENEKETYNRLYKIIMTETRISKTESKKSWKRKADSEEVKEIDFQNYFNYLSSVQFFKNLGGTERITKSYTISGYIPTKLISISPNKDIKIIREFKITRKEYN